MYLQAIPKPNLYQRVKWNHRPRHRFPYLMLRFFAIDFLCLCPRWYCHQVYRQWNDTRRHSHFFIFAPFAFFTSIALSYILVLCIKQRWCPLGNEKRWRKRLVLLYQDTCAETNYGMVSDHCAHSIFSALFFLTWGAPRIRKIYISRAGNEQIEKSKVRMIMKGRYGRQSLSININIFKKY